MSDNNEQIQPAADVETVTNSQSNHPKKNNNKNESRKRRNTVGADVYKSYQKRRRKDNFVPPTVFLLGGNIHDPLNLQGLNHSPASDVEAVSSPQSNHHSSSSKKNYNNKRDDSRKRRYTLGGESLKNYQKKRRKDDIVPPTVFPLGGNIHDPLNLQGINNESTKAVVASSTTSTAKPSTSNKERFQYGNYNRYYGYRNVQECDPRLELFKKDLFEGKDVLDIGCNVGHVTLTIARDFGPRKVVGIDIDPSLVNVAVKNIRHYITEKLMNSESMPISMPLLYGPIQNLPKQDQRPDTFPQNVIFLEVNYVPENDECLQFQEPEYDCILCLSLTKWIHLNWGDDGVKRMFKRIFLHLRPGGCLLLEPQPWSTYHKKSKLTAQTLENYKSIRFKPEHFNEFLLKDVGFKSCELLGTPSHKSKGFQRPIYMYTKAQE